MAPAHRAVVCVPGSQESFNVEAVFVALAKQIKGKNAAPEQGPGSVLNQGAARGADAGSCGSC